MDTRVVTYHGTIRETNTCVFIYITNLLSNRFPSFFIKINHKHEIQKSPYHIPHLPTFKHPPKPLFEVSSLKIVQNRIFSGSISFDSLIHSSTATTTPNVAAIDLGLNSISCILMNFVCSIYFHQLIF
jgi:hypothetical protein